MGKGIFRDVDDLARALEPRRRAGETIVLANGVFDILHAGHVRYLAGAAALGDILVVALNDDGSTRELKGPGRPVVRARDRAGILLALRYVDYVLLFDGPTVDAVIRALRPDVHAKGTDYTVEAVPEIETARAVGCRTIIVGDRKDHATRDMITAIRKAGGGGSRH